MFRFIIVIISTLLLASCVKEGAGNPVEDQANAQSRSQVEAENQNQKEWALKLESDINERKHFIEAIQGTFEGDINLEDIDFFIKVKISSNMPIYFTDRVRTLDEINYEISNLGLNINIKLENPRVANSAVSCIVENYKPNIEKGLIQIISESCKNIFKFILSDSLELNNSEDEGNRSVEIAKNIRAEKINDVEFLTGFFESSVSTKEYKFKVKKVNL